MYIDDLRQCLNDVTKVMADNKNLLTSTSKSSLQSRLIQSDRASSDRTSSPGGAVDVQTSERDLSRPADGLLGDVCKRFGTNVTHSLSSHDGGVS